MTIKVILVVLVVIILFGVFKRYRKQELSTKELFSWLIFWGLVIVAVLIPQTTDFLASKVGVGRGLDLVLVISVITLFYIVFRILRKLEKIEKDITKIVRGVAIHDDTEKRKND
ncbi:MAG: DUF2304 domain-containing protein [Patescibacteria group bacterium]|nr:DUF2304 domain-containing protein [Patescibacteria group bacterium]